MPEERTREGIPARRPAGALTLREESLLSVRRNRAMHRMEWDAVHVACAFRSNKSIEELRCDGLNGNNWCTKRPEPSLRA